jgi:hypothetical protein
MSDEPESREPRTTRQLPRSEGRPAMTAVSAGARAGTPAPTAPLQTPGQHHDPSPTAQLRESLRRLLAALLDRAFGIALDKVEQLSGAFDEIAARGGYKIGALFGGMRAAVSGRNPVWGAFTGAVSALSPGAKAALIAVLILALLLLPITVALLLLFLIIAAVVAVARSRSTN